MINRVKVVITLSVEDGSNNELNEGDEITNLITWLDLNQRNFTNLKFTPEGIIWEEDLGDRVSNEVVTFTKPQIKQKNK